MIVVLGSLNQDLVFGLSRFPQAGETMTGDWFALHHGGKGANQAVAAARLGAKVAMVGRVGDDPFGRGLSAALEAEGVGVDLLETDGAAPTGVALVAVEPGGENRIVVVPGANGRVTPEQVRRAEGAIARADVLLLQLEIPLEAVAAALAVARAHGTRVILDPAPPRELPRAILEAVDVLTPNELEGGILSGVEGGGREGAARAAETLLRRGAGTVILKLGAAGCLLATASGVRLFPGERVPTVDTTAAGDAFAGALGVFLDAGEPLEEAIVFANRVGALATTVAGAQESLPTRAAVESYPWAQAGGGDF